MIYIFSALYWEAGPLTERLSLKKITEDFCFQEFCDEAKTIRLVITGAGAVAAATAAGWMFAKYPPEKHDLLVNVGSCAGESPGAYLCHKLTDAATGRSYYPDMVYRHPFLEGELVTVSGPVTAGDVSSGARGLLYDMEGAALYQAGARFLGPHQMQFIKIVSDGGANGRIATEQVRAAIESRADTVADHVRQLLAVTERARGWHEAVRLPEDVVGRFSAALCCSKTMEGALRVMLTYAKLTGRDIRQAEQELYGEGRLPCKDRREGKERLEELKARLLY